MYDTLLDRIAKKMRSYGENLQPPVPPESLKSLENRVQLKLGCDLPWQYASFLTKANGLDWNGIVVYASDRMPVVGYVDRFIEGFVEANLDFRDHEPMSDYLVFADDGVALFTYHISISRYEVITRVGLTLLEAVNGFDALVANALSGHV